MRAIGYRRVSTEEQGREGVSLDMQAAQIRLYCEANNLDLVEIVSDAGISAKDIDHRPGMTRVLDMVKRHEVGHVVTYKLDRIFRNTIDSLQTVALMAKCGVELHIVTENQAVRSESADDEFLLTLKASLAQRERRLISERTKAALAQKKSKGERVGRVPFGWDVEESGVLIENASEQAIRSEIVAKRAQGHSFNRIAQELNGRGVPSKSGGRWAHTQVAWVARYQHAA
ncbi:MAG: recombinase family protein [Desulfomonile tiedjei]|nr:recombinase family protein [Desulfomonile tiedjei]